MSNPVRVPTGPLDREDFVHFMRRGGTIEDAAMLLCRQGTIDEVRRKAEDLGLI
ncbi:MAG: hypothetical protein K2Y71_13205 [Xanthobacteraceae bacterium]|nr:hypothetical protein [Xanthobacteraceae bacterium]